MNTKLAHFKKIRTISEVLEDAFAFLQLHYFKMLKIIWDINKIYIIAFLLFALVYYYKYSIMLNELISSKNMTGFGLEIVLGLFLSLFILFITARIYSSGYGYIRNYIDNNGEIHLQEIIQFTADKWLGYILLSILGGILIIIGFLFLIIPGIWLIAPVSVALPVYFMEDIGVIDSLKKAFFYIKGRWWYTIAVIFLSFLIILILNTIVSFPATIYSLIKIMSATKEQAMVEVSSKGDILFSILTVISIIGKLLVSLIQIPVMVYLYFSLKEYHTAEGALEKIQHIGKN